MDTLVLSIDPGREKCGMALVDAELNYIAGSVVKNYELAERIKDYLVKYQVENIIVGSGTNSKNIMEIIKRNFPEYNIIVVKEEDTTRQARKYFFIYNPPRGWLRFLPVSLLIPSRPYDDFAAYVIARIFFSDYKKNNNS